MKSCLAGGAAAALLLGGPAMADTYGTITFAIEVSGRHDVPSPDGGFRNIIKRRTFRGTARVRFVGEGVSMAKVTTYDRASFEREKDGCEKRYSSDERNIARCQDEVQVRQNMAEYGAQNSYNPMDPVLTSRRTDVWATESCKGRIDVEDEGKYRRRDGGEGVRGGLIMEVPYSLSAAVVVDEDATGGDSCSVSLHHDLDKRTATITIDPGPARIGAVEITNRTRTETIVSPLDWSAVRKFEKEVFVGENRTTFTGSWKQSGGRPLALEGAAPVRGEVFETMTSVTWGFQGEVDLLIQPPKTDRQNYVRRRDLRRPPPSGVGGGQTPNALDLCKAEQEKEGRKNLDSLRMMQCIGERTK